MRYAEIVERPSEAKYDVNVRDAELVTIDKGSAFGEEHILDLLTAALEPGQRAGPQGFEIWTLEDWEDSLTVLDELGAQSLLRYESETLLEDSGAPVFERLVYWGSLDRAGLD